MLKYILLISTWSISFLSYGQAPEWPLNPSDYEYSMSVIAKAVNDCQDAEVSSIIGVFDRDGNCRGKSPITTYPVGDRALITVYSNVPVETLYFKVYDHTLNETFDSYSIKLDFVVDGTAGSGSMPLIVGYDSNIQADAREDQYITGQTETTLNAREGEGTWSICIGENGEFGDISDPNSTFSGMMDETYVLIWTVVDNDCLPEQDAVTIHFSSSVDNCPLGQILSGDIDDEAFFQASNTITANNSILTGANVTYRAATAIELLAGFEVELGAEFLAEMGECQVIEPLSMDSNTRFRDENVKLHTFTKPNENQLSLNIRPTLIDNTAEMLLYCPTSHQVSLNLVNSSGQIVQTIAHQQYFEAGEHHILLQRKNLPKGLYFLQLQTENERSIEKVIFI